MRRLHINMYRARWRWVLAGLVLLLALACLACEQRSLAADAGLPDVLQAVPGLDALAAVGARTVSAPHLIDSMVPAQDTEGHDLISAGVTLGLPTRATAAAKAIEWAIYAVPGFSAADPPVSLTLDLRNSEGIVWVGLSDFGRGTWEWHKLIPNFTNNMTVAAIGGGPYYRAADGVAFMAILVYDGDTFRFYGGDYASGGTTSDTITVLHRSGQSFITWPERDDLVGERYRIYRANFPITPTNYTSAVMLYEVAEGTGNFYADRYNVDGSGTWEPRYLERFVLSDLGPQLAADLGLLVWTLSDVDFGGGTSGTAYYGVTVTPNGGLEDTSGLGGDLSSGAIAEAVADPMPVEVVRSSDGLGHVFLQYMDLRSWNPTFNAPNPSNQYYGLDDTDPAVTGAIQYAYCYTVGEPDPAVYPPSGRIPVILNLHGWGGNIYPPDTGGAQYWNTLEVRPIDVSETWYFGFAKYHDYRTTAPIAGGDVICNYTEYRILRMLRDLLHHPSLGLRADTERFYVYGHSMGGSGALAMALRFPHLFAAAYASEPMTDYSTDPVWEDDVTSKWGARALNLPVQSFVPAEFTDQLGAFNGTPVYNWQNHVAQAEDRVADEIVPLGVGHGREDETIAWPEQGRPLYAAMDAGLRCWGGYVEDIGHTWLSFNGCPPSFAPDESLVPFGGLGMVLNETVPGLSQCNRDGALPPHNRPWAIEQYNGVIEWSSSWSPWDGAPIDESNQWQMSFRTTNGLTANVDVTPRRLQNFVMYAEVPWMWRNTRVADNVTIGSGIAYSDANGLLTIPDVQVTPEGNRLLIEGPLPP